MLKKINEVFETASKNTEIKPLEDGIHTARLMMARISKQSPMFVKEGEQAKDQLSFVFDVIDDEGKSGRYLSTKCFGISWTDKSSLPKFFKFAKCKNLKEFDIWLDSQLKKDAGYMQIVTSTNDKGYAVIDNVIGMTPEKDMITTNIPGKSIPNWLNKVFGQECSEYSVAEDYRVD